MTDREAAPGPGGGENPRDHSTTARPLDAELRLPASARLAVLGQPIAHSRSPQIHAAAYRVLALEWQYDAIECGAADLEALLERCSAEPEGEPRVEPKGAPQSEPGAKPRSLAEPGAHSAPSDAPWRGLSLTMPLKEEAHRIAAVLDPIAEESGVVNTLLPILGGRWAGFNTDVIGLATAITKVGLDVTRTVIIGSGATAVSAILATRRLGAQHVELYARNIAAASDLVARFGGTRETAGGQTLSLSATNTLWSGAMLVEGTPKPTLVISTLPGPAGAELALPPELLTIPLFDVAYDPWPSPLAERWRAAGGTAHAGTEMLVEQALAQVRIFVAGDPSVPLDDEASVLAAMRLAASRGVEE